VGSEPEQKRQLITLTLQNLEIKDGKLSYEWVKPLDNVFVSAKSHTWGPSVDKFRTLNWSTIEVNIQSKCYILL
jgi:hypothetical protein